MDKTISIIVPVYMAENWLNKCLDSIINQTYKNLEIILINDGSTDLSGDICNNYAKIDSRITVIHKKNEGTSIARNLGIKKSTGQFIQFVDSDDWLELDMCEKLINKIQEDNSDLVLCGLNIYENGKIIRSPKLNSRKVNFKKSKDFYWELRRINLGPCNKLFRKKFITSAFNSSKSLGEDTLFVLDYMNNISEITNIEECLYNVRLDNESSLNRKYIDDKINLVIELLDYEKNFLYNIYGINSSKVEIYNEYILAIHSCFREVVKKESLKKAKLYIRKNLQDLNNIIKESCENCNLKRKDYKIFGFLLKHERIVLLYYFFKLKILINK